MFVERLNNADYAELINRIKEITGADKNNTKEDDILTETIDHKDGNKYVFVKSSTFMKCWISDFTCATRIFDASSIYRAYMGKKFGKEYSNSYREYLTKKSNEKVENDMKYYESTLNI